MEPISFLPSRVAHISGVNGGMLWMCQYCVFAEVSKRVRMAGSGCQAFVANVRAKGKETAERDLTTWGQVLWAFQRGPLAINQQPTGQS